MGQTLALVEPRIVNNLLSHLKQLLFRAQGLQVAPSLVEAVDSVGKAADLERQMLDLEDKRKARAKVSWLGTLRALLSRARPLALQDLVAELQCPRDLE